VLEHWFDSQPDSERAILLWARALFGQRQYCNNHVTAVHSNCTNDGNEDGSYNPLLFFLTYLGDEAGCCVYDSGDDLHGTQICNREALTFHGGMNGGGGEGGGGGRDCDSVEASSGCCGDDGDNHSGMGGIAGHRTQGCEDGEDVGMGPVTWNMARGFSAGVMTVDGDTVPVMEDSDAACDAGTSVNDYGGTVSEMGGVTSIGFSNADVETVQMPEQPNSTAAGGLSLISAAVTQPSAAVVITSLNFVATEEEVVPAALTAATTVEALAASAVSTTRIWPSATATRAAATKAASAMETRMMLAAAVNKALEVTAAVEPAAAATIVIEEVA
jgi:hypothetical protein